MRCLKLCYVTACLTILAVAVMAARADATRMPRHWHAPPWWLRQALCVHHYEGAWNAATGNGYEGGMQFLLSTWLRAGGPVVWGPDRHGRPVIVHWASAFSPREQLYRAWVIWRSHGGSWSEWGTAGLCRLR